MNTPSKVSISDMPAANSSGRDRMASGGSEAPLPLTPTAAVADRPRNPTSVAVSKPSPKRMPTGYICQEWLMNLL